MSRPPRSARRALLTTAALAVFAPGGAAQQPSILQGRVLDASSAAPVADAIVRLYATDVSAVSDAEGAFVRRGLPAPTSWRCATRRTARSAGTSR